MNYTICAQTKKVQIIVKNTSKPNRLPIIITHRRLNRRFFKKTTW